MRQYRIFDTVLKRWFWRDVNDDGSVVLTLADILAAGGDPEDNPITNTLTIAPDSAVTGLIIREFDLTTTNIGLHLEDANGHLEAVLKSEYYVTDPTRREGVLGLLGKLSDGTITGT